MSFYTLITGATGGLGHEFCYQCAERGDNLVLTGTKEDKLQSLSAEIKDKFPNILVICKICDLSSESQRKEFFCFLKSEKIQIDFLINNAGYIAEGLFLDHSDDEILKIIRVNCEGTIDITQKVIKRRVVDRALHIITISSLAGDYPMPYMAIYAATKSMLKNFMIALNYEMKGKDVYITTVCPSGIPTTEAMKDAIKAQGAGGKMTMCPPKEVARIALKASKQHKVLVVPKSVNRLVKGISKLCSEKQLAKVVGKRWSKAQQKRKIYSEVRK